MSVPICPQVCPPCGDSPLSVTGNVVGILTFALAMAASIIAFTSVTRNAPKDIKESREVLNAALEHMDSIKVYETLVNNRNQDPQIKSLSNSYDVFKGAYNKVDEKLCKFESDKSSIWKRFAWWFQERDMNAGIAKVRSQMHEYTAVLLSYLSL
jgi:hypothetical protein